MPNPNDDLAYNPYAPPRASLDAPRDPGECWRDGKLVVMHSQGSLPDRCIRCNEPAALPAKMRTLYWHHPAWYLVMLFNVVIYAVVTRFVRTKVRVAPGLCEKHTQERTPWIAAVVGMVVGAFVVAVAAASAHSSPLAIVAGLLFLGAIVGAVITRLLRVTKVTAKLVWLSGCKEPFLASLPARGS